MEDVKTPKQKFDDKQLTLEDYYAKQDAKAISVNINDALDTIERHDRLRESKGVDGKQQHHVSETGSDVQSR